MRRHRDNRHKERGRPTPPRDDDDRDRVVQGLNGESDESETGPPGEPANETPGDDRPAGDGGAATPKPATTEPATTEPATTEPATTEPATPEPVPGGPLYLVFSATSHVGKIRKNNQDSGYASGNLLVVADGMGGAAAGDLASSVAIEAIAKVDRRVDGEDMLSVLADALHRANDKIADLVADNHTLEGMGTTVSGALFDGTQLGLAHIGDSRAYLLHDGALERITHDHSWVQSLIDDGKISVAEAAGHPHRSLLLRVLNGQPANDPDVSLVPLTAGDRLLFCSDGLCGFVDDDLIAERLAEPDRDAALDRLLRDALGAGGLDNITIVIADVVDSQPAEAPTPVILGAATEVDIPDTSVAPRVIDLGDDEAAAEPSERPAAPAPQPAAAADEDRYAPVSAPRLRWLRRLVAAVVVLVVVAGLAFAGYAWSRTQYYIGPADDRVAIYQGLPDTLPLVPLSRLYEVQQIKIDDLPAFYQDEVRSSSITAGSLEAARQTVSTLRTAAAACVEKRRHPSPSPSPTPGSGRSTPGATPKTPATPQASSSPKTSSTAKSSAGSTTPTTAKPPTPATTSTVTPGPSGPC